jgi:hypothetical protein
LSRLLDRFKKGIRFITSLMKPLTASLVLNNKSTDNRQEGVVGRYRNGLESGTTDCPGELESREHTHRLIAPSVICGDRVIFLQAGVFGAEDWENL